MKKILLGTFLFFAFFSLKAEVLLVENFDYALDASLAEQGYYADYGVIDELSLTNGLVFHKYEGSNVGNAVLLDVITRNHPHKAFSTLSSGDVYVAFLFQATVTGKGGFFFSLRDKVGSNTFNYMGRVLLNTDNQIGLTFGNNQSAVYASAPLDGQKVYLVVLKYSIQEGANNDAVSLYLFDAMPSAEPDKPLIGPLTDATKPDINPENMVLRGVDSSNWWVIDGIRIATSWAEAVKSGEGTSLPLITDAEDMSKAQWFDALGRYIGTAEQVDFQSLPRGLYIVRTSSATHKIMR